VISSPNLSLALHRAPTPQFVRLWASRVPP
jgi:hypothetical protein